MHSHEPSNSVFASFQLIARREKGVAVRIFFSIATTCVMIAVALIASYVIASFNQRIDSRSGGRYFYVTDTHLAVGFSGATLVWGALLYWIWRGQVGQRNVIGPLISTAMIGGITAGLGVTIDELMRREAEYLIAAVCMIAAALVCMVWMRYTLALLRGNPVLSDDRQVNVLCPECGYSLIGLDQLRCPECGATFAIDELIRAQGYGKDVFVESSDPAVIERQIARPPALPAEKAC